jgi:RHS repeat-associated protein
MSRRWTIRSSIRGVVVVLAASLLPALATAGTADAAGPSVPLPEIQPVPVGQQPWNTREQDEASRKALSNDQDPRNVKTGTGTPGATSLSPSATWSVSTHTGDFTWSYPLRVPPASGGLVPNIGLSYRSSAVDGRTMVTNNQPSWIGDGWDLWPGYIERTYWGCIDDDIANKGDLCWRSDNATANYGGSGGMLICCDGTGKWRAKSDDGARIERIVNPNHRNGDNDGEHWKITTVDGTQYWFGSQLDASSTWTVPVFGDDAGEPCHGTTFDNSHCVQAYRWNLDKVIDRNGNMIRYYYTTETNNYGFNAKDTAASYVRGGTLDHIDYGLHETLGTQASGRVEFTLADRCVPGSNCSHDKKDNWPDTALDMKCDASSCKDKYWPTFWSTKRLASVTTKVLRNGSYDPVDRWDLDQQFPDPGDGEKPALWLKGVKHIGLAGAGPDIELPSVTFEGAQMPNRVYSLTDGYAMLNRYRITGVISESGGIISVNYAPTNCAPGALPASELNNDKRCFPVTWSPPNHEPRTDYFHKYVVASIIQSDSISSSTQHYISYEYLDGAAWHFDTSEFTKDDKKTWNEFRGFKRVRTRTGLPAADDPGGNPMTMSEQRFHRGMHNDRAAKLDKTKLRPAEVTDSIGGKRTDDDWLAGFGFESTTYEREAASSTPDPAMVTRTVANPVVKGPNATRGDYKSYLVRPGTQRGFTALKSGGPRETKTTTDYNDQGLPTTISDLGDVSTADDDRCTTTTYDRKEGSWLLNLPRTVGTVTVACGATARFPDHALTAGRFSYDGKGNLEKTEVAKAWTVKDSPEYTTTATARYDEHGRASQTTNALGATSKIEFTPRTGGPVTATKTTGPATATLPLGLITTTTLDPAFGAPVTVVDPNERVTRITLDALGRTSKAWLPIRPRDEFPDSPSVEYTYNIRRDGPTVITTTKIGPNGVPVSSKELHDGLLRKRQTQTSGVGMRELPNGQWVTEEKGRLIVDTRYDTHGRAYKTTQPYFNNGSVDGNLWVASDTEVPGLTRLKFDGAGREIQSIYQVGAIDKWSKKTSYDGDRVHLTPRAGDTATTVISDARGQTKELRQYHGPEPSGVYDTTRYSYTKAGQLQEVIGPDGARWRYGYDLRGRKITMEDPDSGLTTLGYDDLGQLTSSRDALGTTIAVAYDVLGRKTAIHRDTVSGSKLAQWTYDTAAYGKGLLAASTRFVGGNAYTGTVNGYTALNNPLSSSVIIPAAEGLLAGTYTTSVGFGADGSVTGERYPAAGNAQTGGLPEESINYALDNWARPMSTTTAADVKLTANTLYTRYGEVERLEHGSVGSRAWQTYLYDTSTRRLARSIVDAEVPNPMQADNRYTYDPAGNVTSMADVTINQTADIQCMRHDHLQRLVDAWTPPRAEWDEGKGGCVNGPREGIALSGPAPYWHSYIYDAGGNRRTETQRGSDITATRTYTYPTAGQPHTLRSVTGPSGTETLDYNAAGFTTHRTKPGVDETFTWDTEGHLESVVNTVTNKTTSYLYTADGGRLIRRDASGTTLYLPGQEVLLPATGGDPVVTRYYRHAGNVIAMRQGKNALTWLASDHQGTAQVAINTGTKAVSRRRQLPFGAPRGADVVWPNERGFVGGTIDSTTGLTHLGAREYDPTTGRFVSIDPIMDVSDPQQMHGYAYANNSPITKSDPTGLKVCDGNTGDWGCAPGQHPNGGSLPPPPPPPPGGGGGGGSGGARPTTSKKPSSTGPTGKPQYNCMGGSGYGASVCKSSCPPGKMYSSGSAGSYGRPGCVDAGGMDSESRHIFLDLCGQIPWFGELCDITNALFHAAEGNTVDAGISAAGAIPGIGNLATGGRIADDISDQVSAGVKGGCSFDADTLVLLADGSTKPIAEVKVGDQVLAADPKTGVRGARTVIAVLPHEDTVLELSTEDGATVTTTEDHAFYNATDKRWQRADALSPGDALYTATGATARVAGLLPNTQRVVTAYDLTIADTHSFFVLVHAVPVLVHNSCPSGSMHVEHSEWETVVKVNDSNDYVKVDRDGGQVNVLEIYRESQEEIRGSDMLARALHVERIKPGEIVYISHIVNDQTVDAYDKGRNARDSLLGRTGASALEKIGKSAASIDWHEKDGLLNIAITVGE